ncbi:hypothetical protein ACFQX7_28970 [Luedemannella flava]
MTAVIFRMMGARRAHVAIVFALAVLAIAASVAAPVYLLAGGRSLVAATVAAATPREVTITVQQQIVFEPSPDGETPAPEGDAFTFQSEAADIVRTPGFTPRTGRTPRSSWRPARRASRRGTSTSSRRATTPASTSS